MDAMTDQEVRATGFDPSPDGWSDRTGGRRPSLEFVSIEEVAERVAAGPAGWLLEGLWPEDAYGLLGAEQKAGKTWAALDLAVSVLTGSPWLGAFACPTPGPVVAIFGEGGERATLRRLEAIVAARGGDRRDLAGLRLCFRAPKLTDRDALAAIVAELEASRPRLVVLDPLYLAARGSDPRSLVAMGEALSGLQYAAQDAGAALVVTHHWNKTGTGNGADRFSGAGAAEWGRVLGSAAVERRQTLEDGTSVVRLRWRFTGSEIADREFVMARRVRAEDPADLGSALTYGVEVEEDAPHGDGRPLSQARVLAALEGSAPPGLTVAEIGDRLAVEGSPLKARTIQLALAALAAEGALDGEEGPRRLGRWWLP